MSQRPFERTCGETEGQGSALDPQRGLPPGSHELSNAAEDVVDRRVLTASSSAGSRGGTPGTPCTDRSFRAATRDSATRDAFKVVYCSRSSLRHRENGGLDEIRRILARSRDNNREANVSGALVFNAGCFAQVLEGERGAVERIYERIACDPRHRALTVLQSGSGGPRDFADWSMAYAGSVDEAARPLFESTLRAAFATPSGNGEALLGLLRRIVLAETVTA